MAAVSDTTTLEQMWANFCKEPVSEYPTFCGPDSLSCNSLTAVVADQPQTTPDGMGGCVLQVPTLVKTSGKLDLASVQFSRSVMSDSLRPHESQHARPPCPSPTPGVHSDPRPSSQ